MSIINHMVFILTTPLPAPQPGPDGLAHSALQDVLFTRANYQSLLSYISIGEDKYFQYSLSLSVYPCYKGEVEGGAGRGGVVGVGVGRCVWR